MRKFIAPSADDPLLDRLANRRFGNVKALMTAFANKHEPAPREGRFELT